MSRQTPQNKRQEYVNAFNKGTQHNSCQSDFRFAFFLDLVLNDLAVIFLLSSKAGQSCSDTPPLPFADLVLGGVGINLIGMANHNLVTLRIADMPIQEHQGFSSLTRIGTLGLFALNSHGKSSIHHILVVMISSQWRAAIGRFHILPWINRDLPAFSDGQKRPVFIYRLLTAGTIDGEFTFYQGQDLKFNKASEKIYQRQVTKLALSDCMFSLLSSFLILSSLICVALIGSVRFSFVKLFGALNMLQRL